MKRISANYIFPISTPPIKNGILSIDENGKIIDISSIDQIEGSTDDIEFFNGVICPGFINAHCHLELSHLKDEISPGKGIIGFITEISQNRNIVGEDEQLRLAKYYDEFMYMQGIAAVGDISNTHRTFELKKQSKMFYHTFVEAYGRNDNRVDEILSKNQQSVELGKQMGISISPTPHAPYSMCDKLFFEIKSRAENSGIISYHNQETKDENDYFEKESGGFVEYFKKFKGESKPTVLGKTAIHRMLDNINPHTKVLLIHNIFTNENDFDFAVSQNKNITWVLCPQSNLYIENKLAPIDMFRRKNAQMAIGTDSLSSNTDLSIISELYAIKHEYPEIPLKEMLTWATINGAKALGVDDRLGSFEIGKTPGIVLIENIDLINLSLCENSQSRRLI